MNRLPAKGQRTWRSEAAKPREQSLPLALCSADMLLPSMRAHKFRTLESCVAATAPFIFRLLTELPEEISILLERQQSHDSLAIEKLATDV